ncbi:MAG: GatB/YqeY domain-containing protein [Actinomycetota bacterium]|nr:GatB/YqeY domain-containing protein [Actinomycetota bacterium]
MAELKQRLRSDLTAAMKARDELRASTLRMVLTSITNAEVAGSTARSLSDEEVVAVLASEARRRREAAAAFADAERLQLAEKERAEAAIITDYLPAQLSADEIRQLVAEAIAATTSTGAGMKAMGTVMGALRSRIKGRADGGVVAAEVRRQLTG